MSLGRRVHDKLWRSYIWLDGTLPLSMLEYWEKALLRKCRECYTARSDEGMAFASRTLHADDLTMSYLAFRCASSHSIAYSHRRRLSFGTGLVVVVLPPAEPCPVHGQQRCILPLWNTHIGGRGKLCEEGRSVLRSQRWRKPKRLRQLC